MLENSLRLILAALAGVLATTAFAPLSWWPALAVSLLLLWQLWYARPDWAPLCGFAWGLGHFASGVYWLFNSLHDFGSAHWLTASLMTLAFVIYLSLFPALAAWFWICAERHLSVIRYRFVRAMAIASLWWLCEYLRTTVVFGGFPWLASGFSQTDGFALQWFAPLGVVGVGWVYLLIIAWAHTGIRRWWGTVLDQSRRPDTYAGSKTKTTLVGGRFDTAGWRAGISCLAAVGLCLLFYLGGRFLPEWTKPGKDVVRLSVIHTDMPQDDKQRALVVFDALKTMFDLTEQAEPGVVVWPETAIPFYADGHGRRYIDKIDSLASSHQQSILAGVFHRSKQRQFYNAVYGSDGTTKDYYIKQKLVPFGEFMPARWLFGFLDRWVDIPQSDLSAAPTVPKAFDIGQAAVHVNICYELFFADLVHDQASQSEILINVSNDAWFGRAVAPAQSIQMARARAVEVGRVIARASNQGISAIIDWRGRVLSRAEGDYARLSELAQTRIGLTPIVAYGEAFVVSMIILINLLVWILAHWWVRRERAPSRR